jgi:hypothetical protein
MPTSPDDKNIFETTACIPAGELLDYSRHKLAGKELRKVEEHLADCELCSAALEGFLVTAVSAAELNAIQHRIDMQSGHSWLNSLNLKGILGTALVVITVAGIWMYNRNTTEKKDVAALSTSVKEVPVQNQPLANTTTSQLENKEPLPEEKNEIRNFSPTEKFIQPVVKVASASSMPPAVSNTSADNNSLRNTNTASNTAVQNPIPPVSSNNPMTSNSLPSATDNNTMAAPPADIIEPVYNRPMRYIYNLKISDYDQLYRMSYTSQNMLSRGTPSQFEDRKPSESNEILKEPVHVQSVDLVLRDGLLYFSGADYEKALSKFSALLDINAKDVNALFYSGLCYYNMNLPDRCVNRLDKLLECDNNAFLEEGMWYRALAQLAKPDKAAAKESLRKISDGKGFYAKQAKDKLKEMK